MAEAVPPHVGPQTIDAAPKGDAREPRGHVARTVARPAGESSQVDLLQNFFGVRVVAQDRARDAEQALVVVAHHGFELDRSGRLRWLAPNVSVGLHAGAVVWRWHFVTPPWSISCPEPGAASNLPRSAPERETFAPP